MTPAQEQFSVHNVRFMCKTLHLLHFPPIITRGEVKETEKTRKSRDVRTQPRTPEGRFDYWEAGVRLDACAYVRCTTEELALLAARARERGMTQSMLIRTLIRKEVAERN